MAKQMRLGVVMLSVVLMEKSSKHSSLATHHLYQHKVLFIQGLVVILSSL